MPDGLVDDLDAFFLAEQVIGSEVAHQDHDGQHCIELVPLCDSDLTKAFESIVDSNSLDNELDVERLFVFPSVDWADDCHKKYRVHEKEEIYHC